VKYFSHLAVLLSLCLVLGNTPPINAADTPAQSKPEGQPELKVVNLAVYPAPIPQPAMKYRLLPRLSEQTPGNAALLYDTIFLQIANEDGIKEGQSKDLKDEKEKEKYFTNADKLSNWLNTPLAELPKDEVQKILDNVQPWCIEYAKMASKRMQCNWELPVREITNPFECMLPELHRARSLGRILAMKARLSLAEGKSKEALKTLQIGFALSRQVGNEKETIINSLVGIAIANMMSDQLLDLTQLKDAPTLYWSLSNLPHPFLSYHNAVECEEFVFNKYFPELQEARKGQHTPEQWQQLWESLVQRINDIPTDWYPEHDKKTYDAKKLLEENYPKVQDLLINKGWPEKEIRSMAPAHVMLLAGSQVYGEMRDEIAKWLGIDYSQWPNSLREHYEDLLKDYREVPLMEFFPVFGKTARTQARCERNFEILRTIEAIRLYAHSHDGKLPGSLDDVKDVPIPSNPMTGKPFPYHLEGDTAVLMADGDTKTNFQYRIKIAK